MTNGRRTELADAALRVVMRDGLSAVSFRSVAAESGWSLGAVQKAFASKQDLLAAVVGRAQEQVTHEAAQAPGRPDLLTWTVDLLMRTLPLDGPRRAAVLVSTGYADRAGVDAELGAQVRAQDAAVRGQIVGLFSATRAAGGLRSRLDDDQLARACLAFAAGLAGQLLYDPRPEAEVRALVTSTVDALLG